ncbi:MAG TPA: YcxB family protein [Acholeplasmataceae bacterium]|nr:YcxB family protein [Acholeplasmataceae bacterium]
MIKTEFSYEEEEIKDFFRFHLLTKEKVRFIYYITSSIIALIGFILVFYFEKAILGFILIILAIILVLIFPLQVNRVLKKQVRSRYKRPKEVIVFSDENIVQHTETIQIKYSWEKIIEVCETKKYFYLYISSHSAIIVNKTKLDDGDYHKLVALIKKHIDKITYYKNK